MPRLYSPTRLIRVACLCALAVAISSASRASLDPLARAAKRENAPPRKVLIGTIVGGEGVPSHSLGERLDKMDALAATIVARAKAEYPGRRLDLVVLPEYLIGNPGDTAAEQAVPLDQVQRRMAQCARRTGAYIVIPMLLRETGASGRVSNAAVLFDRSGAVAGIYRKVHAVAPQRSTLLEGGITPGASFPVFDCDFGRLGIQICFDMVYDDGWDALAAQGAEIVALPSASPETAHPRMYALQHAYYIVSATPRDHAAVYNPLGQIEAEATQGGAAVVHEIDLSYALVHWDAVLEEGAALRRRFGDKVGYHYYRDEDGGIFYSNDPRTPIGRMIAAIGLQGSEHELARLRQVQDAARGGPVKR